ncbi:helix-turn-helix domain-containing protein [Furfurilactobacillus rossiae]|nr:helix-turn-helix transcriptional regulator [Furfurilactobacillus rossiae]QLE61012.1 TPR domain transcriptional regulator Cro-CI [Furfurilactobacillus rossiae]
MDISQLIKNTRKDKRLTQADLAQGITTQATISQLEKNNVLPSSKILAQIAAKLDINIDAKNIKKNHSNKNLKSDLHTADMLFMRYQDEEVSNLLANYDSDNVEDEIEKEHLLFLKIQSRLWVTKDFDTAIFGFNNLLQNSRSDQNNNIFQLLSLTELGALYEKKKKMTLADFYFQQVFQAYDVDSFQDVSYWGLLIATDMSKYFINTEQFDLANQSVNYGLHVSLESGTFFFVDSLYYAMAIIDVNLHKMSGNYDEYLTYAESFAHHVNNDSLLKKIAKLRTEIVKNNGEFD